jgi:hypothetical protein
MADYDNLIRPISVDSVRGRMEEMQGEMLTLGIA